MFSWIFAAKDNHADEKHICLKIFAELDQSLRNEINSYKDDDVDDAIIKSEPRSIEFARQKGKNDKVKEPRNFKIGYLLLCFGQTIVAHSIQRQ